MKCHDIRAKVATATALYVLTSMSIHATAPTVPNIPDALQRAGHFSAAYRAILASGPTSKALTDGKESVTFLAPTDHSCSSVSAFNQPNVDHKWASNFVLSHTVRGQINVMKPLQANEPLRLNVVSNDNKVTAITDGGTVKIENLLGETKSLTIKGGAIILGGAVGVESDGFFVTHSGSVGTIDSCEAL